MASGTALDYDDTPRDICPALDVPVPEGALDAVERLRLEAELAVPSITW